MLLLRGWQLPLRGLEGFARKAEEDGGYLVPPPTLSTMSWWRRAPPEGDECRRAMSISPDDRG